MCGGCGHWAVSWLDEAGFRYAITFEREPSLTEVINSVAAFFEDVRRSADAKLPEVYSAAATSSADSPGPSSIAIICCR